MRIRVGRRFLLLLFLSLFLPKAVFAQTVYGTIKGAAWLLKTGQPMPSVLVLASSLDRGDVLQFSAKTDDSGSFTLNNLPSGAYKITLHKDGCKTFEEPIVAVSADNTTEMNVKLSEGDPEQKDVDNGSAVSILKLDRADVATAFNRHEIDSLPIYQQNVSRFELLVPGAVSTKSLLPTQQNPQNGIYASLSGQHFSGTSVTIDGTVDRDPLQAIVVLNPSLDSVSELKITTQNYGAEFGPATGGILSVQTRSGTNQLHGSAFGYRYSGFGQAQVPNFNQTSFLQALSYKFDDFGASLGGAPIRDRLFLFGDFRGIRTANDGTVLLTVPTQTVFGTCNPSYTAGPCDLTAYKNAGVKFSSAYANALICNYPGQISMPACNGSVSPEMFSFLQMLGDVVKNQSSAVNNNFLASGVDSFSANNFDARADYVFSSNTRFFTRYSFANFGETGSPAFGPQVGGLGTNPAEFAGIMKDRNQGISAGFSVSLNPTLLTDFRFGFFRYNLHMDSPDEGTTPATSNLNPIGGLNLGTFFTSGMPDIVLDANGALPSGGIDFMRLGYSQAANSCDCPLREREQQFQIVDNWTKLLGRHNIRWGVDFRYLQNFRLAADVRPAGKLEFGNGAITGFSLGDFLIGALSDFSRSYNNVQNPQALDAAENQKRIFLYGEDTVKVNPRLTVNYGLRWEVYFPQSVSAPGAGGWLQLGSGPTPFQDQFVVAGQGTNLQGGVKNTLKNFGPRLGFAYLVNSTTVIRAGYSRMFDPGYAGTLFGIAPTQSPPVSLIATLNSGFTLNSSFQTPSNVTPIDVCNPNAMQGPKCNVPLFNFAASPLTIAGLYNLNSINSPNPNLSEVQVANLYALPRRLRLPTVDAWNVAVQEQLDRHTYLELSYVANKGTHVLNDTAGQLPYYDVNQVSLVNSIEMVNSAGVVNCQAEQFIIDYNSKNPGGPLQYCKTSLAFRTPFNFLDLTTPHNCKPPNCTVRSWNGDIDYFGSDASSTYNALQVKFRHQFSSGFSLLANYTWSKVIDFDNLYYAIDPRVSRGLGNFDRKHNFVMTNIWDLPFGKGRRLLGDAGPALNRVVGGWSLAAATYWYSGLPFTPSYSGCNADVGATDFKVCRPNLVGSVHNTGKINQYFTTTGGQALQATCAPPFTPSVMLCPQNFAPTDPVTKKPLGSPANLEGFDPLNGGPLVGQTIGPWQRPGAGQIGNAGRNSLRGPGFFQSDLAVAKAVAVTERVAVQFRADAFNVFNRLNLGLPNTVVDAQSGAGQISSIPNGAIPRLMQFSLRVTF